MTDEFSRKSKPKFIFGDFFFTTQFQNLKQKKRADVFKFQPICSLTATTAKNESKQFHCCNIVFGNKTNWLLNICAITLKRSFF